MLLDKLSQVCLRLGLHCHVLIVNDGGQALPDAIREQVASDTSRSCEILSLHRNLGHQRAIAVGIAYAESNLSAKYLLVMDADGEDDPMALDQLLSEAQTHPEAIVFAQRSVRSEGPLFRAGYWLFKWLFKLLSGRVISFGNYSLLPWPLLKRLVVSPELWVHYAAGVIRARIPFTTVPVPRAARYAGDSKMNLAGLILHGMAAISLFADVAAVRVLLVALAALIMSVSGIAIATGLKLFTALATPGWATSLVVGLTILMVQVITLSLMLVFVAFQQRTTAAGTLPREIYDKYIEQVTRLS
jgi:hypothetical protein